MKWSFYPSFFWPACRTGRQSRQNSAAHLFYVKHHLTDTILDRYPRPPNCLSPTAHHLLAPLLLFLDILSTKYSLVVNYGKPKPRRRLVAPKRYSLKLFNTRQCFTTNIPQKHQFLPQKVHFNLLPAKVCID